MDKVFYEDYELIVTETAVEVRDAKNDEYLIFPIDHISSLKKKLSRSRKSYWMAFFAFSVISLLLAIFSSNVWSKFGFSFLFIAMFIVGAAIFNSDKLTVEIKTPSSSYSTDGSIKRLNDIFNAIIEAMSFARSGGREKPLDKPPTDRAA
ncbi:MAG: hypothetical protein LBM75_09500 [Myxococcales bacterium]|jgi:hypothetical protein|nr:hypothetical protein [Myxococcales bacterium]